MRIRTISFTTRLTIIFLTLSVLGGSITALVGFTIARAALQQSVFDRLEAVATLKDDEINYWIDNQRNEVLLLSQSAELRTQLILLENSTPDSDIFKSSYQWLYHTLTSVTQVKSALREIFLMSDVGGKVLVSTAPENEGQYNVSNRFFTQGRLDVFIQNVYPSPQTGQPTMTISAPVYSAGGRPIAVLAAHVDLEYLDTIVLERAGLGETGETYLVDNYNSFLSTARFGGRAFPRGVHTQGIDSALSGKNGIGLYTNYEGTPVLGAYHWLKERDIALLAEISQQEAFQPAQQLALYTFGTGAILASALAFAIYLIARRIARPILSISQTALRVADGDLSLRTSVTTQDEIGQLAKAFNQMADQLQRLIGNLEEQVAERTRALERRISQTRAAVEVGKAVAAQHKLDELLNRTTQLISDRFGFYHVGIFLLDEHKEYALLQASNSSGGAHMLARGHKLKVGEVGIVGIVAGSGQARIALDVGKDAVYFNNPDLPQTRSEMALPIIASGETLGVLDIQSTEANAFVEDDIPALQVLSDQLAIALQNARLLTETQQALAAVRRAHAESSKEGWGDLLQRINRTGFIGLHHGEVIPISTSQQKSEAVRASATGEIVLSNDRSVLAAPIQVRDQTIGVLRLVKIPEAEEWTPEEIADVNRLTNQIGVALESARLYRETQHRAELERAIATVSNRIVAEPEVESILRVTAESLGAFLNDCEVSIKILSDDDMPGQRITQSEN